MSRVGNKPVVVPAGVTVTVTDDLLQVKGPKGELTEKLPGFVSAKVDGSQLIFSRADDSRAARANHGLIRALASNMVTGVTKGFERQLEIKGVGFRAEVKSNVLTLFIGFSHSVPFEIPSDVGIVVGKDGSLTISGISRQRVGQVAAVVRGFRVPDHYKGKGIRYKDEVVRIKEGKSA